MSQRRREFLATAGAGAALLLAGCSDSGENLDTPAAGSTPTETTTTTFQDPVPALDITGFRPTAADDGTLVVEVTVENVTDESGSATLRVTATAGGESATKEQSISLEGGASRTYSFEFGFQRDALTGFTPKLVPESN